MTEEQRNACKWLAPRLEEWHDYAQDEKLKEDLAAAAALLRNLVDEEIT